jgi:hypothetical protein
MSFFAARLSSASIASPPRPSPMPVMPSVVTTSTIVRKKYGP